MTTRDRQPPPTPGPEHRRLDVFVGTWNLAGHQLEGPFGPAMKIKAVSTFEWLPGAFFLIHRFEGRMNEAEIACVEIIGYDPSNQSYPTPAFYNDGNAIEWQLRERDGTWIRSGEAPMADTSVKVRCTMEFSNAGNTMTGTWEHSSDGSTWQTFWDVTATRAV